MSDHRPEPITVRAAVANVTGFDVFELIGKHDTDKLTASRSVLAGCLSELTTQPHSLQTATIGRIAAPLLARWHKIDDKRREELRDQVAAECVKLEAAEPKIPLCNERSSYVVLEAALDVMSLDLVDFQVGGSKSTQATIRRGAVNAALTYIAQLSYPEISELAGKRCHSGTLTSVSVFMDRPDSVQQLLRIAARAGAIAAERTRATDGRSSYKKTA